MKRTVNFYENNGGGICAVVEEDGKAVKVLAGFEYGSFNTAELVDDAADGFPNADEYNPDEWNGLTLEEAAEEVAEGGPGNEWIATISGTSYCEKAVTLYPDSMGYAGKKLFGLLPEE